jgi:hypothetical protein
MTFTIFLLIFSFILYLFLWSLIGMLFSVFINHYVLQLNQRNHLQHKLLTGSYLLSFITGLTIVYLSLEFNNEGKVFGFPALFLIFLIFLPQTLLFWLGFSVHYFNVSKPLENYSTHSSVST